MIRVLVMYPRSDGSTFDADYWLNTHMSLVAEKWPQLVRWEADLGGDDSGYHGAAHLYFDSMADFGAAVGSPEGGAVTADVPNYTDVQPSISIFEVAATS